jgi:tripartite-type tricarboxylate transporter receptor subunit TctC
MTIIPTRKSIFMLAVFSAGLGLVTLTSAATEAAEKPAIEVITHAGAGGGTDVNSRMMMLRGRRTLKQDMVVVNKRGGGGASAMNYFMSRPVDGNTIMTFTVGHAITMSKGKTKLKVSDMAPLARGTNDPQILMVNCKTSPYKTPEDFVAGMKKGDKLKFGGTQTGTIDHITVFLWAKRLGVPMPTYLPFKGGGELATQLVAGSIDVGTLNLSEAAAPVEAGDICPLVILGEAGMGPIPKAKTAKALGIDLVLSTTRGFVTHAGVDPARRAELEKGIAKAMQHSMYQAYLKNSGLDDTSPQPSGPWGKQIKFMVGEFGPALKEMGLIK